jgi:hypothetical protein
LSITACPKCSSRKIFQGRLKEGVLTGYTDRYVCRECGYQGSPLIFDNIEEYHKFQIKKKSDKTLDEVTANQTLDKEVVLSEKEKEVVDFLNEIDYDENKETTDKKSFFKNPVVWLSIVIIVGGFWLTSRGGILFIYGASLLFIGMILFFVGAILYFFKLKFHKKQDKE